MSDDWLFDKYNWMKDYADRIEPIIGYYAVDIQPDDYERGSVEKGVWKMIVEKMEQLVKENATLRAGGGAKE